MGLRTSLDSRDRPAVARVDLYSRFFQLLGSEIEKILDLPLRVA